MSVPTMKLRANPGIKRDGTKFDGDYYTDGQWVRFQRGFPRKIGGYRSFNSTYTANLSRGLTNYTQDSYVYCHSGGATDGTTSGKLQAFSFDQYGNVSVIYDRTPGTLADNTANRWMFDYQYSSVDLKNYIIAHVAPNENNLTQRNAGQIFYGEVSSLSTPLAPLTIPSNANATGGIVVLHPYLFYYGSNGLVGWSSSGDPTILTPSSGIAATGTVTLTGGAAGSVDRIKVNGINIMSSPVAYVTSLTVTAAAVVANINAVSSAYSASSIGAVITITALTTGTIPNGYTVAVATTTLTATSTNMAGAVQNDAGIARVWSSKIIKGMPLRAGSGSAPAGIFWAYDAVIRGTFIGGDQVFQFDTIATDTSIISPDAVVDYDGVFYWAGVDRFLMFNGVVRELPNEMNLNWFFDGLNKAQKSKVFAFKVTRYGEIWWAYPRGDATECTHAVIYNVRENSWYDTELPENGRAAGGFNNLFAAPILADTTQTASGYRVWMHEQAVDAIVDTHVYPIQSYFETCDISNIAQGNNTALRITTIEPDFIQSGDMTVQVTGRANARAPEIYGNVITFPDVATQPYEQIVVLKEQRRELRVRFESNTVGGDYQMGQIIAHIEPADGTVLG